MLKYWVEKAVPGDHADFWVKLPSIPAGSTVGVYMYYGNPKAASASSDTETFIRVIDGGTPVVGSWHMDENSGNTVYDSSGNANDGTLYNGPTWVDGKYGKALSFDGENDYVRIEHSDSLNLSSAVTVTVWIKPAFDISWDYNKIVHKPVSNTSWEDPHVLYEISPSGEEGTGKPSFVISLADESCHRVTSPKEIVKGGDWYFLAGTYDGNTGKQKLYGAGNFADGTSGFFLLADENNISGNLLQRDTFLVIGRRWDLDASEIYKGIIDEVRIYNRALDEAEISDLYNYYGYTTTNYPGRVLVRKYASPEPTWGSWGAEEEPPSLPEGTYYWKVIVKDQYGERESDVWEFTVDATPPSKVDLLKPENGAIVWETVNFEWSTVSDASSYIIQIDDEPSFTGLVHERTSITENTYSYTLPSLGDYYWRVRAVDGVLNLGEWADNFKFTVRAWHVIETWTGTVRAPAAWSVVESWTGTVKAPAAWSVVESWIGTIKAPAAWSIVETWSGTIKAPAAWSVVETWTGTIRAPAAWQVVETWSGTVKAPAAWSVVETWTGTIRAPAAWSVIESWTGTVKAPAAWQVIESWTGTVRAPAAWSCVETWTGTIKAPAAWSVVETWTGTVKAPAAWSCVESWTGTVKAPAAWQIVESWTGTVKAPAAWSVVETWSGTVKAPAAWSVVESWTGTVKAPAAWSMVESWTGTVKAPAAWQVVETWTGTIKAPAAWNVVESWTGTVKAPAAWQVVETWTGTVKAPAAWSVVETWSGTVKAPAAWSIIETWTGTIKAPAAWSVVETWTGTVKAPAAWSVVETWTGTVKAPAAWSVVETWTGTVKAPAAWSCVESWTGTVKAPAQWSVVETWTGTVKAPAAWQVVETWTGTVKAPAAWQMVESWSGTIKAPAPPDFSVSVSPTSGEVEQGGSVTATVQVTSINAYSQTVGLSASEQPSGVSVDFNPSSGIPTFSSTMTIPVSSDAPVGTYTITIVGADADGEERTCAFMLTIKEKYVPPPPVSPPPKPDFSVSVSPTSGEVEQGGSTTATVTVTPREGYDSSVSLTASGQPSGVTVTFSPENGIPSFTSTMMISVSSSAPAGTYAITITGTGGDGKVRTVTYSLKIIAPPVEAWRVIESWTGTVRTALIPSFSLSIDPKSASVEQGRSVAVAVLVVSENEYSKPVDLGVVADENYSKLVGLNVDRLPGAELSLSPRRDTPTFTSTLMVRARCAPVGTYRLTIRGVGADGMKRSSAFELEVTPARETIEHIEAGENFVSDLRERDLPVTGITTTAAQTIVDMTLLIEILADKPADAPDFEYLEYLYFDIEVSGEAVQIERTLIEFRVARSWIEQNGVDWQTIRLLRLEGSWEELPTELIGADENFMYFEASMEGFSLFVATGQPKAEVPPISPAPPIFLYFALLAMFGALGGGLGFVAYMRWFRPIPPKIPLKRLVKVPRLVIPPELLKGVITPAIPLESLKLAPITLAPAMLVGPVEPIPIVTRLPAVKLRRAPTKILEYLAREARPAKPKVPLDRLKLIFKPEEPSILLEHLKHVEPLEPAISLASIARASELRKPAKFVKHSNLERKRLKARVLLERLKS